MLVGGKPQEKELFQATKSSYDKVARKAIGEYKNIYDGETMDIYLNESNKELIIAFRGTASVSDIITDINFISNTLLYTARYKNDKKTLEKYFKLYPSPEYDYYVTGHSLGGGLSAQLLREFPFIKEAVVYNAATQPIDLIKQNPNITYLYIDKDPLYNISGRYITNKRVYKYTKGLNGFLGRIIPATLQAHKLNQFEHVYGGSIPDNVSDKDLYMQAKQKADMVYKSHGLYKSAYIQKEYKRLGGRYKTDKTTRKKGINRWLDEKWISVIPYITEGKVIQCGSLNNNLIACRPLNRISKEDTPVTINELIEKFGKQHILDLARQKERNSNIRINWEEGKLY